MTDQVVTSEKPRGIFSCMLEAQAAFGRVGIPKNSMADFGGGSKRAYRSIDDVLPEANAILTAAGIVILPSVVDVEYKRYDVEKGSGNNKYTTTTTVALLTIEYRIVCVEDGSFVTIRWIGEGVDGSDKSSGKSGSYAYKNFLVNTFCIPVKGQPEPERDNIPQPSSGNSESKAASQSSPAIAVPRVKNSKLKNHGALLSELTDDEASAYCRGMVHQLESTKQKLEVPPQDQEAKDKLVKLSSWLEREIRTVSGYLVKERNLPNWNISNGEVGKSVHPDTRGKRVVDLTDEQLVALIAHLERLGESEEVNRRLALCEMVFEARKNGDQP